MTKPEAPAGNPGQPSDPVGALLAKGKTEAGEGGTGEPQKAPTDSSDPKAEGGPEAQNVTLNFGGAARTFSVDDLVKHVQTSEQAGSAQSVIEQGMQQLSQRAEVAAKIDALPEEQRQAVERILSGQPPADAQPETSALDDIIGTRNQQGDRADRLLEKKVNEQGQVLNALAQIAQKNLEHERQQTFEQQVAEHMQSFDVFKTGEGSPNPALAARALPFAKSAILDHIAAAGGNADVKQVVARVAGQVQQMHAAQIGGERTQREQSQLTTHSDGSVGPSTPFSGDDLKAGKVRDFLLTLAGSGEAGR